MKTLPDRSTATPRGSLICAEAAAPPSPPRPILPPVTVLMIPSGVTFRIRAFLVVQLRSFRELFAELGALFLGILHLVAHARSTTRNAVREPSV